jgi:hypothetical protein
MRITTLDSGKETGHAGFSRLLGIEEHPIGPLLCQRRRKRQSK